MMLGTKMAYTRQAIALVVSTDQLSGYTLFTAAGSPGGLCDVTVTANSGVTIAGFDMGAGWAVGSTFLLVNHGTIRAGGGGGFGGNGGTVGHPNGYGGTAGGTALTMRADLTIDNTDGLIAGGGGGGGGGGFSDPPNAAGGVGGNGWPTGTGWGHGTGTPPNNSGDGGAGGGAGSKGGDGKPGGAFVHGNGGAGGAAGKSVALNGYNVTWLGGNDSTHVKGPVA